MTDKTLRARVALTELEAMGLTLDDLLAVTGREVASRPIGPTIADYVPVVADSYQPRSRRTYNSYWTLTVELLGDVALERVTVDDLMTVAEEASRRAKQRRVGSDGRASRESCVAAMRAVFTRAHKAGLVEANPAQLVGELAPLSDRTYDRIFTRIQAQVAWAERDTSHRSCPPSHSDHRSRTRRGVRGGSQVRGPHPGFGDGDLNQGGHQRGGRGGGAADRRATSLGVVSPLSKRQGKRPH